MMVVDFSWKSTFFTFSTKTLKLFLTRIAPLIKITPNSLLTISTPRTKSGKEIIFNKDLEFLHFTISLGCREGPGPQAQISQALEYVSSTKSPKSRQILQRFVTKYLFRYICRYSSLSSKHAG